MITEKSPKRASWPSSIPFGRLITLKMTQIAATARTKTESKARLKDTTAKNSLIMDLC